MPIDPERAIANLQELRSLTGDDRGAQRVAWTPTWLKARAWFKEKLRELPGPWGWSTTWMRLATRGQRYPDFRNSHCY